jgi:hypothetical protein
VIDLEPASEYASRARRDMDTLGRRRGRLLDRRGAA